MGDWRGALPGGPDNPPNMAELSKYPPPDRDPAECDW